MLTAVLSSEVPATPLGSFPAIFNQALALGTVSRRRVYHEAQQHQQRQKKRGKRWQKKKIALDVPCRSAANTAEVSDFHWHLASNDRVRYAWRSITSVTCNPPECVFVSPNILERVIAPLSTGLKARVSKAMSGHEPMNFL